MIWNYILTAFRTFLRHKLYSFINVASLAVGLVAGLFIYLYVDYETSFDTHWVDGDRIYRVHTDYRGPNVPPLYDMWSPFLLKDALERYFPNEIEIAASSSWGADLVRIGDDVFVQTTLAARKEFLRVMQFESVNGGMLPPLSDPNTVYISEKVVPKYFGTETPIGGAISIDIGDDRGFVDYVVRGVFKALPSNSHLQVEVIRGYSDAELTPRAQSWRAYSMVTYVKLKQGADISAITDRMADLKRDNIPNYKAADGTDVNYVDQVNFPLLPLTSLHMDNARGEISGPLAPPRGDASTVKALIVTGFIIVIIGAINFVNLTTARAGLRAREVALRKTMGATRWHLMAQFLIEAMLMAIVAGILAVVMANLLLPFYANAVSRDMTFSLFGEHGTVGPLLLVVLGLGLLGGLYPAWYLSRFQPADILRANKSGTGRATLHLRQILVVLQFAASITLIATTAIIYQQTDHARRVDTGFDLDNQLVMWGFNSIGAEIRNQKTAAFRDRVKQIPGVTAVSRNFAPPYRDLLNFLRFQRPGQDGEVTLELAVVDGDYDEVFGLHLLAGRFVDHEKAEDEYPASDSARETFNIVVNKKAITAFGFATPEAAVGQAVLTSELRTNGTNGPVHATIVGVVDDVQYGSVRGSIEPMVYTYTPARLRDMGIRFTGRIGPEIRSQIQDIWRELVPEAPFNASFLNAEIEALYGEDARRGALFAAFSALAVFIACVGLYGLSAFSIEQRKKEIGIRKILGASTGKITNLLSWQFSKYALFANVIGWPIAWVVAQSWLESFTNRIDIGLLPFLGAGLAAFLIAWITVATHALRAAANNPVHSLRAE